MKRANNFLRIGLIGLAVSLAIGLLMHLIGLGYNLWPYSLPWIAFIIIGIVKRKHVINN